MCVCVCVSEWVCCAYACAAVVFSNFVRYHIYIESVAVYQRYGQSNGYNLIKANQPASQPVNVREYEATHTISRVKWVFHFIFQKKKEKNKNRMYCMLRIVQFTECDWNRTFHVHFHFVFLVFFFSFSIPVLLYSLFIHLRWQWQCHTAIIILLSCVTTRVCTITHSWISQCGRFWCFHSFVTIYYMPHNANTRPTTVPLLCMVYVPCSTDRDHGHTNSR